MVDFRKDLGYAKASAIAFAGLYVVLTAFSYVSPQLASAIAGAAWLIVSYVLAPVLFGYAGFLAGKGGKGIADSAVSGLIAGFAGSLAFAILDTAFITYNAASHGAPDLVSISISVVSGFVFMVAIFSAMGAICGAAGGFASKKLGKNTGAQPPARPQGAVLPPQANE